MSGEPTRRDAEDVGAWEAPAVVVQAPPLLVGVPEAGRMLGLSPKSVQRMIRSGELVSVLAGPGGGRRLLRVADLAAWAAGLPVAGGER